MDTEVELALRELQGLAVLVPRVLRARAGRGLQVQLVRQAQGSPEQVDLREPQVQLAQVVRPDRPARVLQGRLVPVGLQVRPVRPVLKESPVPRGRLAQQDPLGQLGPLDLRGQVDPRGQRGPRARPVQADLQVRALLEPPVRVDRQGLQVPVVVKAQPAQVRISTT